MIGSMATIDSAPAKNGRWFRRRSLPVPTWRGWLLLLLLATAFLWLFAKTVHPFLAVRDPSAGGLLVVEGWAPDFAFQAALNEFRSGRYQSLVVTGGPLERGASLSSYGTYAELGAASLRAMGADSNSVVAVPAPKVRRDRTYNSAVALGKYFEVHPLNQPVHLFTVGAHARRSKLLFEKALGDKIPVTVYAVDEEEYDPTHWWRSSAGVRLIIGELLAYAYVKVLFNPTEA
jgi:uncharacterized SAM-binding protein YcdF (DUF218 family)